MSVTAYMILHKKRKEKKPTTKKIKLKEKNDRATFSSKQKVVQHNLPKQVVASYMYVCVCTYVHKLVCTYLAPPQKIIEAQLNNKTILFISFSIQ